ncbi:hypothetical protein [Micromonospora saelicesensis]|uniref:hypothetical protein n=1 Tax=Micromonospora saelicesensis TaxID=285676 RepID=UPI0011BD9B9F|nr:hypothetical protein [Micromonospora saelicesensis]
MVELGDQPDRMVDLLERALRAFITQPPPLRTRRKKNWAEDVLASPRERHLAALLGEVAAGLDPVGFRRPDDAN